MQLSFIYIHHRQLVLPSSMADTCQTEGKSRVHLTYTQLECGTMPNAMAALPNIGGALCSMPQSLADTHY